MNVCLIGDGLISLTLAKTLINNKIKVFLYSKNSKKKLTKIEQLALLQIIWIFFKKK